MTTEAPTSMRAIGINEPGPPEVLQIGEQPVPLPAADEVLIRVHAAGVNRPDVLQRLGLYPCLLYTSPSPRDIKYDRGCRLLR